MIFWNRAIQMQLLGTHTLSSIRAVEGIQIQFQGASKQEQ